MKYEIDVIKVNKKSKFQILIGAISLIVGIGFLITILFDLDSSEDYLIIAIVISIIGVQSLYNGLGYNSGERFYGKCYINLEEEKAIITTSDSTLLEAQWLDIKQIRYQPYKMNFHFSNRPTLKFSIAKLEKPRKESLLSDLKTKSEKFNFEFEV